ncbi:MAG: InlB B-repeat-containing protein [Clostridia bacterium]|nr:InlB B-repeat-containing protein [Clostridia bacterium]
MKKLFGFIALCFMFVSSMLITGCGECKHYWLHYETITYRTCTEGGRAREVCDICGAKREVNTSSYGGHKWDDETLKILERGDCHTPEKVEYSCENFGCTEKKTEYRTIPHSYERMKYEVEPSCTTDGKAYYTCYWCDQPERDENGNIFYRIIESHGHDYRLGTCLYCKEEGLFKVTVKTNYEQFDIDLSAIPETFSLSDGVINLPQLSYPHLSFEGYHHTSLGGSYIRELDAELLSGDITLYAYFEPEIRSIYVSTQETGGTYYQRDFEYYSSFELPVVRKTGHTFVGYYNRDGEKITDNKGCVLDPNAVDFDPYLNPKFEINKYDVTYYVNNQVFETRTVSWNDLLDVSLEPPKMTGKLFLGWYDEEFETMFTDEEAVTTDIAVYARLEDGYEISSVDDWQLVVNNPTKHFIMTEDINFNGQVISTIGNFTGSFDGDGHKIEDFMLNSTNYSGNFGLFGSNSGLIKDLTLTDFTVNFSTYQAYDQYYSTGLTIRVGAFVGSNTGIIKNVKFDNPNISIQVNTFSYTLTYVSGLFAGKNAGTIEDCSITGVATFTTHSNPGSNNIQKTYYLGGFAGENVGEIERCYSGVELGVSSTTEGVKVIGHAGYFVAYNNIHIGGLVGLNQGSGIIKQSYSSTSFSNSFGITHDGYYNIISGGFVGLAKGDGKIEECYSLGSVSGGARTNAYMGAFVGQNDGNSFISSCYSTGIALLDKGATTKHIGGFVGLNNSAIQNCYSSGKAQSTSSANVGGFVGYNNTNGTIRKSYTTAEVESVSGRSGRFAAVSNGQIDKGYNVRNSLFSVGSSDEASYNTKSIVTEVTFSDIIDKNFLENTLSWDENGWYIYGDDHPFLKWEDGFSHNYVLIRVVEATCENTGYTLYTCSDAGCNKMFLKDIVAPLGHDTEGDGIVIKQPTCIMEGEMKYACANCDGYIVAIPALDHIAPDSHECDNYTYTDGKFYYTCSRTGCAHNIEVSASEVEHISPENVAYKAPSCGTSENDWLDEVVGNMSGRICKHCVDPNGYNGYYIITGCKELSAHSYKYSSTQKEATCTVEGEDCYVCETCQKPTLVVVPKKAHTYPTGSLQCSVCREEKYKIDASFIAISTVEDLQNVSLNPAGNYYLTKDIDLNQVDFKPIGKENDPFVGVFMGNGFAIKNLTLRYENAENVVAGLFAYNAGDIVGVTLTNVEVVLLNTKSAVAGMIAAYNSGTIYMCKINGASEVTINTNTEHQTATAITEEYNITYGGFAGINKVEGFVSYSTIEGALSMMYVAKAHLIGQIEELAKLLSTTSLTNKTRIVSGGLVGANYGVLNDSEQKAQVTYSTNYGAVLDGAKRGKVYLELDLYDGGAVGINANTISNCKAKAKTYAIHGSSQDYYEENDPSNIGKVILRLEYIKVTNNSILGSYNGLVGKNIAEVDGLVAC